MISFVLSVILNTLALILASRIMDVGLRIFPAFMIISLSQSADALLRGSDKNFHALGLITSVIIYFAGLKFFTGESLWTLFKLSIFSILLCVVITLTLARLF